MRHTSPRACRILMARRSLDRVTLSIAIGSDESRRRGYCQAPLDDAFKVACMPARRKVLIGTAVGVFLFGLVGALILPWHKCPALCDLLERYGAQARLCI